MEFIELDINKKKIVVINFPKNTEIEQLEGDIIYKQKGQLSFEKLPNLKNGYLKLISKIDELNVEKIFDKISPYDANQISGKRFIDSFLNLKKLTIDETFANNENLKEYKFLDNPYIFELITK